MFGILIVLARMELPTESDLANAWRETLTIQRHNALGFDKSLLGRHSKRSKRTLRYRRLGRIKVFVILLQAHIAWIVRLTVCLWKSSQCNSGDVHVM